MDDFTPSTLHESKNEWSVRLLTILTPFIVSGFQSIFNEAVELCKKNKEPKKYLITFQNIIQSIPKWSNETIENECNRIIETSGVTYIEDLITCIHVIHLKLLTAIRPTQAPKKIDIDIPRFTDFVHQVYINCARKLYTNVYLFESSVQPLQYQKNMRELEHIVQECILNTVRDNIPIEGILHAYMEESIEEYLVETVVEEPVKEEPPSESNTAPSSTLNVTASGEQLSAPAVDSSSSTVPTTEPISANLSGGSTTETTPVTLSGSEPQSKKGESSAAVTTSSGVSAPSMVLDTSNVDVSNVNLSAITIDDLANSNNVNIVKSPSGSDTKQQSIQFNEVGTAIDTSGNEEKVAVSATPPSSPAAKTELKEMSMDELLGTGSNSNSEAKPATPPPASPTAASTEKPASVGTGEVEISINDLLG